MDKIWQITGRKGYRKVVVIFPQRQGEEERGAKKALQLIISMPPAQGGWWVRGQCGCESLATQCLLSPDQARLHWKGYKILRIDLVDTRRHTDTHKGQEPEAWVSVSSECYSVWVD